MLPLGRVGANSMKYVELVVGALVVLVLVVAVAVGACLTVN